MSDRRAFLRGLAAVPLAAALGPAAAAPTGFDPAAYVADLRAIGCRPYAFRAMSSGGILGPWRYGIASPEGRGFGRGFHDLVLRWNDALAGDPNSSERVAVYLAESAA